MPSWRGHDGKKLVIALCRDTIDETQKGAPAHLRVGFGKVWWLEGSTNSDTCNALRGAVHSLPLGVLDFTLDWHHETLVKQPKVDDVNVAADLLKPPSVRPTPVMDALEALQHLEDVIFAGRNGGACAYGVIVEDEQGLALAEKTTTLLSNSPEVLKRTSRQCTNKTTATAPGSIPKTKPVIASTSI